MSLFSKLLNRKPVAEAPAILPLPELLVKAVKRMSETDKDVEVEAATLALELRERSADYKNVRAIATDIVYEGDSDSAEKLMNLLARYGFGDGAITIKQPERIEREEIPEVLRSSVPNLYPENLFLELALSPDAYAAVLLGDSGTGLTTLIQALMGAALRHPCPGISITVLDFVGEPDWAGGWRRFPTHWPFYHRETKSSWSWPLIISDRLLKRSSSVTRKEQSSSGQGR